MKSILEYLKEIKIVPVVKLNCLEDAIPVAEALCNGKIPIAEITFRTACAGEAIKEIIRKFPDMLVGAGTVLSIEEAKAAIGDGAKFIVAPGFNVSVVRLCQKNNIPVIPGCATASEVQKALSMGLNLLKFFPAEQMGGIKTIRALSAPFPQVMWMPTGGISLENLREYLSFPKVIACGGSYMVKDEYLKAKNWTKITTICQLTNDIIHHSSPVIKPSAGISFFSGEPKKYDAVGMGEILMRLATFPGKRIAEGMAFRTYVGGSEFNVISGMAGLGLKTAMLTKLPDNDIGRYAIHEIEHAGVDTGLISFDSEDNARLGTYYSESSVTPRKAKVIYDRVPSSFLKLDFNDLPESIFHQTRLFHISGITLSLEKIRAVAIQCIQCFQKGGALISFDVDYRANLWDEKTANETIRNILPFVDVLFVSEESSRRMFHKTGTIEQIMKSYCTEYGIRLVVSSERKVIHDKEHAWNSVIYSADKDRFFHTEPYRSISVVDRIGSGDAFDAGVLFGLLTNGEEHTMSLYGNAMAALKCTVAGDLPNIDKVEVEHLISSHTGENNSEMER